MDISKATEIQATSAADALDRGLKGARDAASSGKTEVLPRTSLLLEEEDRPLTIVNGAVTLQEVVEVLNVLGVTPRDMIQILQLMAQSGMLHAEILVM